MAESRKRTEDPDFKPGVMSPKSKQAFSAMNAITRAAVKQKLILDEDSFEQTFLRCGMCKEKFNTSDRSPRLLPCHHSFCLSCIMDYYKKESEYRQSLAPITTVAYAVSVVCKTCSGSFISTEEGLKQLATDHRIVQLMDFVGTTDKQTVVYCPKHSLQPLNFFCERCFETICRDCTVLDHKECSASKAVIDIPAALEKYTSKLDEGVTQMETESSSLKEKKTECESILAECQDEDETLINEIKTSFEKIRKALNDREQELLEMAESHTGKGKKHVESKIKTFTEKEKYVTELIENIKKAKLEKKIKDMFAVYSQLGKYETEPAVDKNEVMSNEKTKSSFSGSNESTLVSKLSNYGDIQTSQKHENGISSSSTPSVGSSSSYTSSIGSYSAGSRYLAGSSTYGSGSTSSYGSGSSYSPYTSRYTPRSYKY